jgi:DNA-directed RNA polymerase sigma subunit (sigma70/sigma32)
VDATEKKRRLCERYGVRLKDRSPAQAGWRFQAPRQRSRPNEAKLLRRLKHPVPSKRLRTFLDD